MVASTTAYADPCGSSIGGSLVYETARTYMCYGSFSSKSSHNAFAWPKIVRSSEPTEKRIRPLLLTNRATHQLSSHRRTRYSQLTGPTGPRAMPLPISDVPLPRPRPTNLGVPPAASASAHPRPKKLFAQSEKPISSRQSPIGLRRAR